MSDPLADFFARKDKKKKSGRKDDLVDSKSKEKKPSPSINLRYIQQDDDAEWADFEENQEKDYSNLKIQTLTIKDREEEFREQKMLKELQEKQQNEPGGPWSKKDASKEKDAAEEAKKEEEEPKPEEKAEESSKPAPKYQAYRPPSQRAAKLPGAKSSKTAPEINNEAEFPTLG